MLGKTMELIGLLQSCFMQDLFYRLHVAKGEVLPVGLETTPGEQPLAVLQLLAQHLDLPLHIGGGRLLHTSLLVGNLLVTLFLVALFGGEEEQTKQQSDEIAYTFHAAKIAVSVNETTCVCCLFATFAKNFEKSRRIER